MLREFPLPEGQDERDEGKCRIDRRYLFSSPPVRDNLWLCCAFLFTKTGTVDIVERFGKFERVAQPGCSSVNCLKGYTHGGTVSMRVQKLDVVVETKTLDNAFVDIVISIQYSVLSDAIFEAFYKLANPREQIRAYVFDVVRFVVPRMTLNDLFVQKADIATEVRSSLCRSMADYGYKIDHVLVTDIDPEKSVKDSMNSIVVAARRRTAAQDTAEAEKLSVVKNAEAESEAKYLSGLGVARQREAIAEGMVRSMEKLTKTGIDSKEILETILTTQYFDTLRELAHGKSTTVFVPHGPHAAMDSVRSGMMQGMAAMAPNRDE